MRNMATAVLILIISFGSAISWAEDLLPPPWRGKARTTFQNWIFNDDDNPAFPEHVANPWGDALAYMSVVEPIGAGWVDYLLGRNGIWGDLEEINLQIDNVEDPTGRKEVWIQITYYHPPSNLPIVSIPGGAYLSGSTIMLETFGYGSWFVDQQVWEMVPNPDSEIIHIITDPAWGMTIDEIVVDTACFPEKPFITDVARNATGNVEITWTSSSSYTYSVEVSTIPYDYDEENMAWVYQESGIAGGAITTTWEDTLTPTTPGVKFYRIYTEGPTDQKANDTIGMMVISLMSGRNMVSIPFEPYPDGGLSGGGPMGKCSLNKGVGNQLTGHDYSPANSDNIEIWNNATANYTRAWYCTYPGFEGWYDWDNLIPPLFDLEADVGYWFNIVFNHPDSRVTFCGRVSQVDRSIPINVGATGSGRNLVGTCFPVSCTLDDSGLVASGFTGHDYSPANSDNVEFWNNGPNTYERFWYCTYPGYEGWMPWVAGDPLRDFQPGDGFWINIVSGHSAFNWTYPAPPNR